MVTHSIRFFFVFLIFWHMSICKKYQSWKVPNKELKNDMIENRESPSLNKQSLITKTSDCNKVLQHIK